MLFSGITSLWIFPITFASGILTINSELLKLNRENSLRDVAAGDAVDKHVEELVKKWEGKHRLRYASYTAGWVLSLASVVLQLRR
jgi:hypothetical protein